MQQRFFDQAAAMAGGCRGFLVWNFYHAKVFMGDTGSLFLSGLVIALCFGTGLPLFVLLIGVIYVVEMASVVIQATKVTEERRPSSPSVKFTALERARMAKRAKG